MYIYNFLFFFMKKTFQKSINIYCNNFTGIKSISLMGNIFLCEYLNYLKCFFKRKIFLYQCVFSEVNNCFMCCFVFFVFCCFSSFVVGAEGPHLAEGPRLSEAKKRNYVFVVF
jgi:hypothetical protein